MSDLLGETPIDRLTRHWILPDPSSPMFVHCTTSGLPSSLRLGKVEVSCEGWSSPGDSNVLQGSCGLTYKCYWDKASSPSEVENPEERGGRGLSYSLESVLWRLYVKPQDPWRTFESPGDELALSQ
jgi:hypothetical protein